MKSSNITACYLIRFAGIGLCLASSAWIANSIVRPLLSSLFSMPALGSVLFDVIFGVFAFATSAAFVWLAWRLWRSWNASTVRWFIGIWIAILLVWVDMFPTRWTTDPTSRIANMITSVFAVLLIIFGAIAFRYLSHRLIRIAGLDEVLDIYGQSLGHQARIRSFAGVLGWAIFFAGLSIDQWGDFSRRPDSWRAGVATLGPIILGYFTYKLIIWFAKPRTRPSLPAGGFEVIINAPPVHGTAKLT